MSNSNVSYLYLDAQGGQKGPFPLKVLATLLQKHIINGNTIIWKDGMEEWKPVRECDEFKEIIGVLEKQWMYMDIQQQQHGPIVAQQLLHRLSEGELDGMTMVWSDALPAWQPLSEVLGFRALMQLAAPEEEEEEELEDSSFSGRNARGAGGGRRRGGGRRAAQRARRNLAESTGSEEAEDNANDPDDTSFSSRQVVNEDSDEEEDEEEELAGALPEMGTPEFRVRCLAILKEVSDDEVAGPFLTPVDTNQYTDYLSHIQTPMDLETVSRRVKAGHYDSERKNFLQDMKQIWKNCVIYNGKKSGISADARHLQGLTERKWKAFITSAHRPALADLRDPTCRACRGRRDDEEEGPATAHCAACLAAYHPRCAFPTERPAEALQASAAGAWACPECLDVAPMVAASHQEEADSRAAGDAGKQKQSATIGDSEDSSDDGKDQQQEGHSSDDDSRSSSEKAEKKYQQQGEGGASSEDDNQPSPPYAGAGAPATHSSKVSHNSAIVAAGNHDDGGGGESSASMMASSEDDNSDYEG